MGSIRRIGMAAAIVIGSMSTVGVSALLSATPSSAATCTDSWQGPTTGTTDWNASAANWSAGFPTSSSVVCISAAGTYTVGLTSSVSIGTLQVGGGASGTQTLKVDGSGTNVSFSLGSASTVSTRGVLTFVPSTGFTLLSGPGAVTVNSGGTLSTGGTTNIAYLRTNITNAVGGTVTIGSPSTAMDQATTTSNAGTFTIASGGHLGVAGSGVFTNTATINLTGTMTVGSATFNQTSGSITGNPVVMSGGGVLADTAGAGAIDVTGSINLSGTVPAGQTVTVDGSGTNVVASVTSPLAVSGSLIVAPGSGYGMLTGSSITVNSGGHLSTTGTQNIAYLRTDLTNHAGGTITIGLADSRLDATTTTSNAGTFTIASGGHLSVAGSGVFTNTATINLTGTMTVGSATFNQTSGPITGNPVVMSGGGTLTDAAGTGAIDVTGTINASGTVPAGQTVTIDGSATNVVCNLTADSTVDGTLTLAPSTGFAILDGPGAVTIGSGGHLTTTGAANTAYLRTNVTNQAGGTISIGAADSRLDQGTTTFNAGTFTVASGGHLSVAGGGVFTNTSTMNLTGTVNVASATFNQTSGSITGNPVVMSGGGTLADTAGAGAFDVTGTINASGTIPTGQTVTIDGSGTNVVFNMTSSMTDDGTVILAPSTGFAWLNGPGTLTIAPGAALSTVGTTNTAYLRAPITNQAGGTITIGSQDSRLDGNTVTTNAGTLQVANGGHLSLSSGSSLPTTGTLGTTVNATGPTTSGITGGTITAGGTFGVTTIGTPTTGTVFSPISGSTLTGAFTNFEYGPHGYTTAVSGTGVNITATGIPFTVTAKPIAPTAHQPVNFSLATVATLIGTPTYTATVNWGDGTTSAGTVTAGTVSGRHSYATPGPVTVTVSVHGSDGTTITSTKAVVVKADPVPTVASVTTNKVAQGGTYSLAVAGTGLTDNAVPSFSAAGVTVLSTTYTSPTKLTVKVKLAPNATVGLGNVTITTDGGAGTCTGCLTVDPSPKVTSILPVPVHGATTTLTVKGSGFQTGLVVTSTVPGATFGAVTGQTATTFSIQITIPVTTAAGAYKLTVANPDGGKVTKPLTVS